jgi:hypothetical protein
VIAAATQTGDGGDPGQGLLQLKIEIQTVTPIEGSLVILAIFGRHGLRLFSHYCVLPRFVIDVSEAVTRLGQGQIVCIQAKERATRVALVISLPASAILAEGGQIRRDVGRFHRRIEVVVDDRLSRGSGNAKERGVGAGFQGRGTKLLRIILIANLGGLWTN